MSASRSRWLAALGALGLLLFALHARPAKAAFGFKTLTTSFIGAEGEFSLAAGSHPDSWTTTVGLNTEGPPGEEHPEGALRNLTIELPAGLVGDPWLLPRCARGDFLSETCPAASAVGRLGLVATESQHLETPVYLLDPLPGSVAQLGLSVKGVPVTLDLSVSPRPPYNLIARLTRFSQVAEVFATTLTLEGSPGGIPFLTLPRSCANPLVTSFAASSWSEPSSWVTASVPAPQPIFGCGSLAYKPVLSVSPTTDVAAAPSGLDLSLDAPDPGIAAAKGRAAADTAAATLDLPPGFTLNPPLAAGLQPCTAAQLAAELPDEDPATGCPEQSKIGTATVTTPLFDRPIAGTVYVAQPDDSSSAAPGAENPFDSLLALYLVLRDPERGVLLSLPIRLDADPRDGRLTARFAQIPELPISHLDLRFNSGPHAPLTTPSACGSHAIGFSLQPSSGNPPTTGVDSFTTSSNCPAAFGPQLSAGTTSSTAASEAPFVLQLSVASAEPNPAALHVSLPPGVSADFATVPTCPESEAASAACPPGSQLGYARVALGAGPEPLWVPAQSRPDSNVYLAGPYQGAPYSFLIRIAAKAGPFDLGQVVLRAPVRIDPETAQASVDLGGLPQILDGIPLRYRTIRLVLDRPGFIRNPTSCKPLSSRLDATAVTGATATASDRFQAADCATLAFKPRLSLRFGGATGRNGHPEVSAVVRPRGGDANVRSAALLLPRGVYLDQARIRGVCTRAELAARRCPADSAYGRLAAWTPLLSAPLRGRLFLLEGPHRLPDLVAYLDGQVDIVLRGRLATPHARVRAGFERLPDVPFSRLALTLRGGRRGLLVDSENACTVRLRAGARFAAHNGRSFRSHPRVTADCGGAKTGTGGG